MRKILRTFPTSLIVSLSALLFIYFSSVWAAGWGNACTVMRGWYTVLNSMCGTGPWVCARGEIPSRFVLAFIDFGLYL
jgi:hypothetical protein